MAEMSECSRHEEAIYYEAEKCPLCAAQEAKHLLWDCVDAMQSTDDRLGRDAIRAIGARNADALLTALGVGEE